MRLKRDRSGSANDMRWLRNPVILAPVIAAFVSGLFAVIVAVIDRPPYPDRVADRKPANGSPDSAVAPQPHVQAASLPDRTAESAVSNSTKEEATRASTTVDDAKKGSAGIGGKASDSSEETFDWESLDISPSQVAIANTSNRGLYFKLRPADGTWRQFYLGSSEYGFFWNSETIRIETSDAFALEYRLQAGHGYAMAWNEARGGWDVFQGR